MLDLSVNIIKSLYLVATYLYWLMKIKGEQYVGDIIKKTRVKPHFSKNCHITEKKSTTNEVGPCCYFKLYPMRHRLPRIQPLIPLTGGTQLKLHLEFFPVSLN